MRESDWLSAHAFYHDDLDRLLLGAVAPLVERLTEDGLAAAGWFYLRYWDGGPHLRLRILASDGTRDRVRGLVEDGFTTYFAADPARGKVAAAEYRRTASGLAELEGLDVTEGLHPNNSLAFIPYRRELDRYGRGAAIEAVERHFVESSRIALGMVESVPTPRRTDAAYAMLLLAWFAVESEVEGVLVRNRRLGNRYPHVEPGENQVEWAADLATRMRALAARAADIAGSGALLEWARATATLRDALAACGTPPARAAEVLDDCAHLLCNRLGVSLAAEGRLRALAVNALDPAVIT